MGNCAIRERESVILWDCGQRFAAALKMTLDGFHQIRLNFNLVCYRSYITQNNQKKPFGR